MSGPPTPLVNAISNLDFQGNILHTTWFQTIQRAGIADLIAILILSEMIYWYRRTEVKDELSGQLLGYRKRFQADLWQVSYSGLAHKFGLTKRQVQDAIERLEKTYGVLKRVFRTITSPTGLTSSNVLFLEPDFDRLLELNASVESLVETLPLSSSEKSLGGGVALERRRCGARTSEVGRKNAIGIALKRRTYTKTSTKTPTDTYVPLIEPENDEDRISNVDEFVEMYNYSKPEVCPEVAKITPKRRERYASYLALFPSMRFWEKTFELMHFSDWIRGKVGTSSFPPVARDLDWLCQKGHDGIQNCLKVYEKKYSNKKAGENGEWVADDGHPLVPKTYNLEPFVAPFSSAAKPASSED